MIESSIERDEITRPSYAPRPSLTPALPSYAPTPALPRWTIGRWGRVNAVFEL